MVADSVEQARREAGDLLPAVVRGVVTWEQVRELADIVAGNVIGRTTPEEITLFESQGVAVEDVTPLRWCIAAPWSAASVRRSPSDTVR